MFNKCILNLVDNANISNTNEIKRLKLYLEWLERKSKFFEMEKFPLSIPDTVFPNKITKFA